MITITSLFPQSKYPVLQLARCLFLDCLGSQASAEKQIIYEVNGLLLRVDFFMISWVKKMCFFRKKLHCRVCAKKLLNFLKDFNEFHFISYFHFVLSQKGLILKFEALSLCRTGYLDWVQLIFS